MSQNEMIEIRWHGRGGQGAKTAALLFAEVVLSTGKYIQAFPEYGPERMGAPVQSFNRISDEPITLHCAITAPKYVIVLDPSLMDSVPVSQGLKEGGKIIVNTTHTPEELAKKFNISAKQVSVVNASQIALDTVGLNIPNTPMLGALVKVAGNLDINDVLENVRKKLDKKFRHKPQVIDGNIESIKRAYNEVKSG